MDEVLPGEQGPSVNEIMARARSDPAKAVGRAAAWERDGGDEGARHCAAVALLNSGEYEEAARRLESLAATTQKPGTVVKSELYAQAGQAWLIAGRAEEAVAVQTTALEIGGPQPELLIDRAITCFFLFGRVNMSSTKMLLECSCHFWKS
jgi:tetratricopeptide (TPR) repeat protein